MKVDEDGSLCTTFDLEKSKGETMGIYLRQGDGFDHIGGIFVSRLEMGSAAEMMGIHMVRIRDFSLTLSVHTHTSLHPTRIVAYII